MNALETYDLPDDLIPEKILYSHDDKSVMAATFRGKGVVIKQGRTTTGTRSVLKEYRFVKDNDLMPIVLKIDDLLPIEQFPAAHGWGIEMRLVRAIPEAMTPSMLAKGKVVFEMASGVSLSGDNGLPNPSLPIKFHMATIIGYLLMCSRLANNGKYLDSNMDTDLLVHADPLAKRLSVVKIDCEPAESGIIGGGQVLPGYVSHAGIDQREVAVLDQVFDFLTTTYTYQLFNSPKMNQLIRLIRAQLIADGKFTFLRAASKIRSEFIGSGLYDRFAAEIDEYRLKMLGPIHS